MIGVRGYAVGDLVAQLGEGVATVLPWIGAGVSSGVVLLLLFVGVRKAFQFFRSVVAGPPAEYVPVDHGGLLSSVEWYHDWSWASEIGMTDEEADLYADGVGFNHLDTTGNYSDARSTLSNSPSVSAGGSLDGAGRG